MGCAILISSGHTKAFYYGYSFFKLSLESLKTLQKQQILGVARAIGLLFSGEKEIQDFLEE